MPHVCVAVKLTCDDDLRWGERGSERLDSPTIKPNPNSVQLCDLTSCQEPGYLVFDGSTNDYI